MGKKRVIWFIGLKMIEIAGLFLLVGLVYFVGNWFKNNTYACEDMSLWICGFLFVLIGGCILAVIILFIAVIVWNLIRKNWEWAGRLSKS